MNNIYNNDYIGAIGINTNTEYIDEEIYNTSNIIINDINITSNILDTKINTNITTLDNKYNKLINEQIENNLINTYVINSNIGGEIRFYVKNSGIFDINNASGQLYRVKIGADGKLYLYYNYNIAIGLLETERWVEPINMLIGHNVAIGNLNAITGATDIAVSKLLIDVNELKGHVFLDNVIRGDEIFYNPNSTYDQLRIAYNTVKNQFTYANSIYAAIVGSVGFGIVFAIYGFIQSKTNADFIENNLQYQLSSNTIMTTEEKIQLKTDSFLNYQSNLNDMNTNLSNLNIINGFINSNIITQQFINNLNVNTITLNNVPISSVLMPRSGGSFSGSIAITPATIGIPSTGNFGGNGDRIVLYSSGTNQYPYSIGIASGSLWNSIPTGSVYDWYIQGSKVMTLDTNGGLNLKSASYPNIQIGTNNNLGLATANGHFSSSALVGDLTLRSANNLILQSGDGSASIIIKKTTNNIEVKSYLESSALINSLVSLQENSVNLTNKYLQITDYNNNLSLQNDIFKTNLGVERKYPPKLPDSSTTTSTAITFLGQSAFLDTLTINNYINGYGLGTYTIYSTSIFSFNLYTKNDLFNINTQDIGGHWANAKYSSGNYIGTTNYIKNDYYGEWIVIKLPTQIVLTRYRFYQRPDIPNRAPGLFKWYGSNDGINFTEIVEASNTTTTALYSLYHEKTLAPTFTTPYLYLGLCVNKLYGSDTILNFAELMIWGKELINPIINYTPTAKLESSVLAFPNISKKYGFTFTCSATTTIGLITYYKYDIDLRNYTQLKYTTNYSPYRIFNIRLFLASCFFQFLTNSNYNILSYEVYMSNQLEAGTNGATIGLHVVSNAIGATYPSPLLANVLPSAFSLMRTTNFDYLSVISTIPNITLSCIINDLLF